MNTNQPVSLRERFKAVFDSTPYKSIPESREKLRSHPQFIPGKQYRFRGRPGLYQADKGGSLRKVGV